MILVADYCDRANLLRLSGLKWVFIGNYRGSEYLRGILKPENRIFIGKLIEEVMASVQDNFVDYIGSLCRQQDDKVLWYSSRMASKSILTSMFHQYVYLKILERLLEGKTEDILLVTDNNEFYYNIGKIFSERVRILTKKRLSLKGFYKSLRGYAKIGRYCIFWLLSRPFKTKSIHAFDLFIHSWIDERVFQKLPAYNDSYFGDLENTLKGQGCFVGRLAPLRVSLRNILKLNRHFNNIVYPMAYLPLRDLLKSIFTAFSVKINRKELALIQDTGILYTLLENEIAKENSTRFFLEYIASFYSYKNMSRSLKSNATVIYPFENQPWERMFNFGFAGFRRIAYQHTTIPHNMLDYRISQYEDKESLPQVILTTGKKWSYFLEKYYTNSVIEKAGAIRYSHLFDKNQKGIVNTKAKNIVVALDLFPHISIPLQRQLLNLLGNNGLSEYTIKIKPHTYLPKDACFERDFASYKNCRFVKDGMGELLKNCSLLVTSNSSVIFESVFSGIKTLYFIPEEPTLGVEYYLRDSLFIAYSENFSEKFKEALGSMLCPKLNIEEYFSPPDYNIFLKYVSEK